MKSHSNEFSIERMAKVLDVSRSGYYSYIKRKPSKRSQSNQFLLEEIKMIHNENRMVYGSPRIHAALQHKNISCGINRIARLMSANNIVARTAVFFKKTTKPNVDASYAENLLQQDFSALKPNEKWVSDISYIYTREGWLYLAVVLDLYSRYIVGMSMSSRITSQLVTNAFNQAMKHRGYPKEFIYHSDKGSQYTSKDFQGTLKKHNIIVSMSGTGNCYDNAAMETFFHSLKTELVYLTSYATRELAENDIFDYIETFYNTKRLHSYLGYLCPKDFEKKYTEMNKPKK